MSNQRSLPGGLGGPILDIPWDLRHLSNFLHGGGGVVELSSGAGSAVQGEEKRREQRDKKDPRCLLTPRDRRICFRCVSDVSSPRVGTFSKACF